MPRRLLAALAVCVFATVSAHARPARWCGWYARHFLVTADPGERFNLACAWRDYGTPTTAQIGALAVWCNASHHHVGKIVGGEPGAWIIRSGNDAHAVRERVRSVKGAVFRWPA